ncbi:MAG: hypothetical protein IT356_00010 [Gemmatimonadaceae bacterium]|nr:hypothetical protein [Gemmatimonadaceae bacterium]
MDTKHTAIHEAGHAVAHVRHGIDQAWATIVPSEGSAGNVLADEGHWNRDDGEAQVLSYCAGFAALVAAGHSTQVAEIGCDDDFKKAVAIIEFWDLGNLDTWKARAVDLMQRPENVRAVALIADQLLARERVDADHVQVLVDVADGETTVEELAQYLAFRDMVGST